MSSQSRTSRGDQVHPGTEFRRILLATDFSPIAGWALDYPQVLCKKFRAKLFLVHVLPSELHFVIGIERGRASRRWRVSILALSVCKVGSQFPHSHVSRGPPIIPDGRVSQVRFEVLACRQ